MADDRIKEAVMEYLTYHNMNNTLQCFEVEARQKLKNVVASPRTGAPARNIEDMRFRLRRDMITAYDDGLYERFFILWAKHVPEDVRDNNEIAQKLEFYLNIHFAVAPFRTSFLRKLAQRGGAKKAAGMAASAMLSFRKFLETRGQALSQTPEFLSYYALPYVPNPSEHPSFKHLLKEKWLAEIRHRLERFLDVILESVNLPDMYKTFAAAEAKNDGGEAGFDQQREKQLKEAFFAREEKLKDFARSVYSVSIELVQALDRARNGESVRDKFMDYARHRLSSFNDVLSAGGKNVGSNLISAVPQQRNPLRKLDYTGVRADLSMLCDGADEDTKAAMRCCRLLQALRWRLNRARPKALRNRILQSYITNDLLGCSGSGSDVLSKLLKSKSKEVREYVCRLVNHLASEIAGRSYLLQHQNVLPLLIDALRDEHEDTITRQNVLGALNKFSLRRKPQTVMIENDLIAWIASILKRHSESETKSKEDGTGLLSEYTIEYATALLMNLSVRTLGKIKCEDKSVGILTVMNDLLESDNHQVRTYVNGTLYSVLTRPSLKDQALEMGMDEMLRRLMTHSDDEFKRQIEYILNQLRAENTKEDDVSDGDEDEEEEEDADDMDDEDDEPEEDDEETLPQAGDDDFEGESLLVKSYATKDGAEETYIPEQKRSEPHQQHHAHQQQQQQLPEAFKRPTTPGRKHPAKHEGQELNNNQQQQVQYDEGKKSDDMGSSIEGKTSTEEGQKQNLLRTTRAEDERNKMVPEADFQSKPRISRTPLNDYGYVEPGEFGQKYSDGGNAEDEKEKEVLRYNKPGVTIDPEMAQAFTNRPKLSRTPNTDNNNLMYEEGEFGN